MLKSVTHASLSKPNSPKPPLENIMATHPLELVHLAYLCLEPGKGLEENVLVLTDHFTSYTHKLMLPKPKLPRPLPKPYGTSSLSDYGLPDKDPVGSR